jgi:hypothetical protein
MRKNSVVLDFGWRSGVAQRFTAAMIGLLSEPALAAGERQFQGKRLPNST